MTDKFQISADAWGTLVAGLLSRWPRAVRLLASQTRLEATPRACRTHSPSHFVSPRLPPRAATEPQPPPLLRLRLTCSSLQKRAGHLAASVAVISSTTSTFQPRRLRLGKGVIASSSTAAMVGPRRSWRSTRPAVLAPFHPLLCLALGHRNPTEARRVTVRGCVAVSSPESAVPWLCAAVSVADPSSHYPSTD